MTKMARRLSLFRLKLYRLEKIPKNSRHTYFFRNRFFSYNTPIQIYFKAEYQSSTCTPNENLKIFNIKNRDKKFQYKLIK